MRTYIFIGWQIRGHDSLQKSPTINYQFYAKRRLQKSTVCYHFKDYCDLILGGRLEAVEARSHLDYVENNNKLSALMKRLTKCNCVLQVTLIMLLFKPSKPVVVGSTSAIIVSIFKLYFSLFLYGKGKYYCVSSYKLSSLHPEPNLMQAQCMKITNKF